MINPENYQSLDKNNQFIVETFSQKLNDVLKYMKTPYNTEYKDFQPQDFIQAVNAILNAYSSQIQTDKQQYDLQYCKQQIQQDLQQTQKTFEKTLAKTQSEDNQQSHTMNINFIGLEKQIEQQLLEECEVYKELKERYEKLKKTANIQTENKQITKEQVYGLQEEVQLLQQLTKQIQMNIQAIQSPIHMLNTATQGQIEVNVQQYVKLDDSYKNIYGENQQTIQNYKAILQEEEYLQNEKRDFKNQLRQQYIDICKNFDVKV